MINKGTTVAVKAYPESQLVLFQKECSIYRAWEEVYFTHRNILKFIGTCMHSIETVSPENWLIFEYHPQVSQTIKMADWTGPWNLEYCIEILQMEKLVSQVASQNIAIGRKEVEENFGEGIISLERERGAGGGGGEEREREGVNLNLG